MGMGKSIVNPDSKKKIIKDFYLRCFEFAYFDNANPGPVLLPMTELLGEKICLFCNRKAPEVTFRNESHLIPRGLGNKNLLYRYECDSCNKKYGDLLDNDLVRYFSIARILGRKIGGEEKS